ncbi:MAG: hypothetical protein NC122_08670 [Faecalibacterium sp.]|nr:hypothetical protein [Ruminococcus sp.]MCM1392383.1 hypothetical protein [Ruminococcus sp.]MCM1486267.1 hypothetical protein [Faecalibacterium sp.]
MKKFISIVLAIFVLLSAATVNVAAIDKENEKTTVISEWDEYQKIVSMTDQELKDVGYSEQQIDQIRNFDYEKEIKARAKLDDETLKAYGYTKTEIDELRKVAKMNDIPIDIMKTISNSTLTTKLNYISNGSRTEAGKTMYYVNMKFSWKWNKIPYFKGTDMIVVAFSSSTANAFTYYISSANKVTIYQESLLTNDAPIKKTIAWTQSTSQPNSINAKIDTAKVDANSNITHFVF